MCAGRIGDVDFALYAGKPQCKPFLLLAAVFAFPGETGDVARNVVAEPFRDFTEPFDRGDVGFFAKFPQGRRPGILAPIDTTLRHLPGMAGIDMLRPLDTAADKRKAGTVEHHDADTGAIR